MPIDYWNSYESLVNSIQGQDRRQIVQWALEEGVVHELSDEMLQPQLDEEHRRSVSLIHPSCMGGEFLPAMLPGEVEIARIVLQSTTGDVIVVRARREAGAIRYRIVDEYEDSPVCEYPLVFDSSPEPLTLEQLIALIDGTRFIPNVLEYNFDGGDGHELRTFVSVESPFYPDLGSHYADEVDTWLDERAERERDDRDEDTDDEQAEG
jgi:hypothetical protein